VREGFVKVAQVNDLSDGRGKRVTIGDEEIALWKVGGRFYAISSVCAHQHLSTLHAGVLDGLSISCPMHGWKYSLITGKTESGQGSVRAFRILVEEEDVYIEIPRPAW
jgi:nitrite reductase/ring-hydroxylating ferredoxin subunit